MEDQITAADLEGVVDAPSDNEGDDNVDMDQVHAKMMRDQDKQEQEELIRQVQDGWANNGKRGGRRRRGQFDEGYMNEGANNRHRKRLRLDGSEDDENEEDEEGLDEEDMLARRAERDAIRRGSDDEARYSDEYDEDEEGDEGFNNRNKVDAEELAERNAAAAVRRRAYRSQALRKQKITADMDIANGGRGPNILRQQSVVEDDDESQRILGLTRRHNDASQNSLMARVVDSSQNGGYDASLLAVDSAGLVGIEAAGGGKNMQTLYARVTAGQGAGSSVGSSSSASSSSFSSLGKRRRPKSCEPSIGGSTASNAAALSTNVFQPFSRRTFTQMSSFRTSSISISQHSWSSKSQSSNAQAIVKDRGSKKAFVWRTDSQSMSQFGGLDADGESGGGGGGGAFSFRPLSNGAVSRDGITKGKTPGTAARGHRGAVMHHRGGGPGLPSASDSMIGSKRPASGGLFQALSSSNNFRKKARA